MKVFYNIVSRINITYLIKRDNIPYYKIQDILLQDTTYLLQEATHVITRGNISYYKRQLFFSR